MAQVKTQTWEERRKIGERGEEEFRALLGGIGFIITQTGQEKFMPTAVHDDLRRVHDDLTIRALRFQPDFMAYRDDFPAAFFETVVNTRPDTPNFAIEKAKYDELMSRRERGQRCAIAVKEVIGTWAVAWVQDIKINKDMSANADRWRANGSKTPYLLVAKVSFLELNLFVNVNTTGMAPTMTQGKMF